METGLAFTADKSRIENIPVPDLTRRNVQDGTISQINVVLPSDGDQPFIATFTDTVGTGGGFTHPFYLLEVFSQDGGTWKKSFWVQYPGYDANAKVGSSSAPPPAPTLPNFARPLSATTPESPVAQQYSQFLSSSDVFSAQFNPNSSAFMMGFYTYGTVYRIVKQVPPGTTVTLQSQPDSAQGYAFKLSDGSSLVLFATDQTATMTTTSGCVAGSDLPFAKLIDPSKKYARAALQQVFMLAAIVPPDPAGKIAVDADWESTTSVTATPC